MGDVVGFVASEVSEVPIDPITGSSLAVAQDTSDEVISYTAIEGDHLRGFSATGTRNSLFTLSINGTGKYWARIETANPNVTYIIPGKEELASGDVVALTVENEGQGDGDYNATLFIEPK